MYNGQERREPGRGNSNEVQATYGRWRLPSSVVASIQQDAQNHATTSRPIWTHPPPDSNPTHTPQERQVREQAYNATSNSQVPSSQVQMHQQLLPPPQPPSQSLHPGGRSAPAAEPNHAVALRQQYQSSNSVQPPGVIPGSAAGPPTILPSSHSRNTPTIDPIVKENTMLALAPIRNLYEQAWNATVTGVQAEMGRMHTELVDAYAREHGERTRLEQEVQALKEINERLKKEVDDHIKTKVNMTGVSPQVALELERLRAQNETLMQELEYERASTRKMRVGSAGGTGGGSTSISTREMPRSDSPESEDVKFYIDQQLQRVKEDLERQKEGLQRYQENLERERRAIGVVVGFYKRDEIGKSTRTMRMSSSPSLDQGMQTLQMTNASPLGSQIRTHARQPDSSSSNKISSESPKLSSPSHSTTYVPLSPLTPSIRPQEIFSEQPNESLTMQVRRRLMRPENSRLSSVERNEVKRMEVEAVGNGSDMDMDVDVEIMTTANPSRTSESRRGSTHGVEASQSQTSLSLQRIASSVSRSDSTNSRPPAMSMLSDSKTFTRSPSPITAERPAPPPHRHSGSRVPGASLPPSTSKESQLGKERMENEDEAEMEDGELRDRESEMDEDTDLIPPIAVKMEDGDISTVVATGSRSRPDQSQSQPQTQSNRHPIPRSQTLPTPPAKPVPTPPQTFNTPASLATSSSKPRPLQLPPAPQLPPQSSKSVPLSLPVRSAQPETSSSGNRAPAYTYPSVPTSVPPTSQPYQARPPHQNIVSPSYPAVLIPTTMPPHAYPHKNPLKQYPPPPPSASATSVPMPAMGSLKRDRTQYEDDSSAERTQDQGSKIKEADGSRGKLPASSRPTQEQLPSLPKQQSNPSKPSPIRSRIGIGHLDLLYETRGTELMCRMCRVAQRTPEADKNKSLVPPVTFQTSASWDELTGHFHRLHPKDWADLEKLTPVQVGELKRRMLGGKLTGYTISGR
ncbi:hypothetical protein H0H92_013081 [Tricholoma furcatifolium]|nr:hypothetical protein H0H92_013081 [Tricholoma furcatifolium]